MDSVPVSRLEHEWQKLASKTFAARLPAWREREPALARFTGAPDLLRFLAAPGEHARKDDVLRALLALARSETIAARAVLHALLPGLKTLARRLFSAGWKREEVWELLLAFAWERIVTYPLERRPNRIAANLLLDTLRAALGELSATRASELEVPAEPLATRAPLPSSDGDVEALIARAVVAGAISAREAELVLETRIDGEALVAAAARSGASYNTTKVRRQRAERRLLLLLGFPPEPRRRQRRLTSSRPARMAPPARWPAAFDGA